MNGKWAGITDLIDGDSDRLDAVTVILLAQGLNVNAARVCSVQGRDRGGEEILDGVHYLSPPETLLEVNSYRFPVLSSLPHTLNLSCRSFSRSHVSARSSPARLRPSFLSLPQHTAPPSYYSLTRVKDTWVLSVARLLTDGGGRELGLPATVEVRFCCLDSLKTITWLFELF